MMRRCFMLLVVFWMHQVRTVPLETRDIIKDEGLLKSEIDNSGSGSGSNVNVYLVRSKRFEDQRGSSSGYVYQTGGHDGPTSYVSFQTSYAPVKSKQQQVDAPAVLPLLPVELPTTKHLAKKEVDAEAFKLYEGPTHMEVKTLKEDNTKEDDNEEDEEYEIDDDINEEDDDDDEDELEDKKVEGHGSSHEDSSNSKHGSKSSSGYSKKENFAKRGSGNHESESTSGSHSTSGGNKSSNHADEGHSAESHAAGHSQEGGSHSSAESHKKGSKTTGYHKIYRKDEYKKDHTFYDEKDASGHFDTYGSGHKQHSDKSGGFRKGGQHASGHQAQEQAAKGHYNKGRYDHQDAGSRSVDGGEKYHKDGADYKGSDGKHSYREQAY